MKDSVFAELVGAINDWQLQSYFTITISPLRIINNLTKSDIIFR
jgi:phage terminase large subunit